jgi:hypothetical protein
MSEAEDDGDSARKKKRRILIKINSIALMSPQIK